MERRDAGSFCSTLATSSASGVLTFDLSRSEIAKRTAKLGSRIEQNASLGEVGSFNTCPGMPFVRFSGEILTQAGAYAINRESTTY